MSSFSENRISLIGNLDVTDHVITLNDKFKKDKGHQFTAVGRILYGYSGLAATLKGTAIRGGAFVQYIDETRLRPNNAISFGVQNQDAKQIQEQLLMLYSHLDPKLVVANDITDEYCRSVYSRYILLDEHGCLNSYESAIETPDCDSNTAAGFKKYMAFLAKAKKESFGKLKTNHKWVTSSMLISTFDKKNETAP